MREIIFRGKSVNDGRWVFGNLSDYGDCKTITTVRDCSIIDSCEVIPETVGQYTGLKDLHGRSVFEGDIVKIHLSGKPAIGVVEFGITGIAAYIVKNIDKVSSNYVLEFDKPNLYEVVGNVFDNSLEGKT